MKKIKKSNALNFNKKFVAILISIILILFFTFGFKSKIFNKKNNSSQNTQIIYQKNLTIEIPNFHKIKYDYQTSRYFVENNQDNTLLWNAVNKLDKDNARILIISPYLVNSAFRESNILSIGVFNNWDWYLNEIDTRTILYSQTKCPYGDDDIDGQNIWVEQQHLEMINSRYKTDFKEAGCYYFDLKNQSIFDVKKYQPITNNKFKSTNKTYTYLIGNINDVNVKSITGIKPDLIIMDDNFKKYFPQSYDKVKALNLEMLDFNFTNINDFTLFLSSFGYHLGDQDKINSYFQYLSVIQDLFKDKKVVKKFEDTLFLTYQDQKLYLRHQDLTNTISVLSNGEFKYTTQDKALSLEQIAKLKKKNIFIIYQDDDQLPLSKRVEYQEIFNKANLTEPMFILNHGFYDLAIIKQIETFVQIL